MNTILTFLRELEENNHKSWFDAHREEYRQVRTRFDSMVEQLLSGISAFDHTLDGVGVKESIYRINKDMRFSRDGLPYKTHLSAYMVRGGKKSGYCGYYFHIGTGSGEKYPAKSFLAVGNYFTEPRVLKVLREDIEMGKGDFDRIIKNLHPALSLDQDQKLKKVPQGFKADGPYIEYIKLKNFCLTADLDTDHIDPDEILKIFQSAKPFLDYINRAIEYCH